MGSQAEWGGVTPQDSSFCAMAAPGAPCTSPHIQPRSPPRSGGCSLLLMPQERGLHSSRHAGYLGSRVARERKLRVEESSHGCRSPGPQRAPPHMSTGFGPAEKGQGLAITVSVAHKKSPAPLSNSTSACLAVALDTALQLEPDYGRAPPQYQSLPS